MIFFLISFNLSAGYPFRYIGIGSSSMFRFKKPVNDIYSLQLEWMPHQNVGTRIFAGGGDGALVGSSLVIQHSTSEAFSRDWHWSIGISVPFLFRIKNSLKSCLFGLSFFNSFSFRLDKRAKYFLYITPFDLYYFPFSWELSPVKNFKYHGHIFYMASIGIRVRI
jgi:hypothetical protein